MVRHFAGQHAHPAVDRAKSSAWRKRTQNAAFVVAGEAQFLRSAISFALQYMTVL